VSLGDVMVVKVLDDILATGNKFQHEFEQVLVGIGGLDLASFLCLHRRKHVLDE
jgi:hypothetical protein